MSWRVAAVPKLDRHRMHRATLPEAEAVPATHREKGETWKRFVGAQLAARDDGAQVVGAAGNCGGSEGVAHLGEHRAQAARAVVAEPEAHRVEDEAEDARHGLQHDLAVGAAASPRSSRRARIHGSSGRTARALVAAGES